MHKTEFDIEETVYLKTDPEQLPRIITRYQVSKGSVIYELCCGAFNPTWHYGFEITRLKEERNKQAGFNANA